MPFSCAESMFSIQLVANAPIFFPTFMKLLSSCWSADRTLRSLDWQVAVLRTAATLSAPYEWDVNEPVARIFGITEAQFNALKNPNAPLTAEMFTPRQRLVARFVEEFQTKDRVSDETMAEAKKTFGDEGTMELFYTAGVYGFLARTMNSCKIDFDPVIPGLDEQLKKVNAAAIEKEKSYKD
jgi:alkylhydroperoxidase family enzyme